MMNQESGNRVPQMTRAFAADQNMTQFGILNDIGIMYGVSPCGNCMHLACLRSLYFGKHPDVYQRGSFSFTQRESFLAHVMANMNLHRMALYEHFVSSFDAFTNPSGDVREIHNAIDERLPSFNSTSRTTLLTTPGSPGWTLYNSAVDYNSGCSQEYWGSLDQHLPLYAHYYKRTFVCYSTLNLSNTCFAQRVTFVCHYDVESNQVHQYVFPGQFMTPPHGACCIMLSANHFNAIRLHQDGLTGLFQSVKHFGFLNGYSFHGAAANNSDDDHSVGRADVEGGQDGVADAAASSSAAFSLSNAEGNQSDDVALALIDAATLDGTLQDIVAPVRSLIDSIQLHRGDDHEDAFARIMNDVDPNILSAVVCRNIADHKALHAMFPSKQFGLRIVKYPSDFGSELYDAAAVDDLPIDLVNFAASVNVDKNNVREVMAFNYLLDSVTPPSEENAWIHDGADPNESDWSDYGERPSQEDEDAINFASASNLEHNSNGSSLFDSQFAASDLLGMNEDEQLKAAIQASAVSVPSNHGSDDEDALLDAAVQASVAKAAVEASVMSDGNKPLLSRGSIDISPGTLNNLSYSPGHEIYPMFDLKFNVEKPDGSQQEIVQYKPFTEDDNQTILVSSTELLELVEISVDDGQIVQMAFVPGAKSTVWFNDQLIKEDFPNMQHVIYRAEKTSICTSNIPHMNGRGKRPNHPFALRFCGWCSGRNIDGGAQFSRAKKSLTNEPNCYRRCSTAYYGGFTYTELLTAATAITDTQIEMQVRFSGQCRHVAGKTWRAMRSSARKRKADEVYSSQMEAKEFAKHELSKLSTVKFVVGNHTGEVTTAKMAYNLKQDARRDKLAKKGILPKNDGVSNILRAVEITEKKDLQDRIAANDKSEVLPGIARKVQLHPVPNIYFHSRSMLNLAAEIASHGRLVIGIDGSGNMLNIKESRYNGKFQHLIITLQPDECLLTRNDGTNFSKDLFHSVILAERMSPINTAPDVTSWVECIREDTKTATRSLPPHKSLDFIPAVIKLDCAMELLNGTLAGFRSQKHVSSGEMYNNVMMILLIQHETKVNTLSNSCHSEDELEQRYDNISIATHREMTKYTPSIMHWCDVHVYSAVRDYRKNKRNPPHEFFKYKDQIDLIFWYLAHEMKTINTVSQAIIQLCIVAAVFDTEFIPCADFRNDSNLREHHDESVAERYAMMMDTIANEERSKILSDKRWQGKSFIEAEMFECNVRKSRASTPFKGKSIGQNAIERMKKDMLFGIPYLNMIDKDSNVGTVKVCLLYSCYENNLEGAHSIKPQRVGGFEVQVTLPYTSGKIKNPLYSPTAASYIVDHWMNRIGLWAAPLMEITQRALNARIYTNNQGVEGTFCYEKHHVSTKPEDIADIASYIHRRYNDNLQNGRMLRCQFDEANLVIEARKRRAVTKESDPTEEPMDEEESDMQWRSNSRTTSVELQRWSDKMNVALKEAKEAGMIGEYSETVRHSKWEVLYKYASTKDTSFMSYTTFNTWMAGKRKTRLTKGWRNVIDSFAKDASNYSRMDEGKSAPTNHEDSSRVERRSLPTKERVERRSLPTKEHYISPTPNRRSQRQKVQVSSSPVEVACSSLSEVKQNQIHGSFGQRAVAKLWGGIKCTLFKRQKEC